MCPQNKKRGQVAHLSKPGHEWGPKPWRTLSPRGWAKLGSRGAKPPWQGVWGMCPQNKKRGQVAHLSKPGHEWGPELWRTLSLRGWAKRGSRETKPPAREFGGVLLRALKMGLGKTSLSER